MSNTPWEILTDQRIFFGHQSVGRDIMNGLRALIADGSAPSLRLIETDDPGAVTGPAFMEKRIGRNREPGSKLAAFEAIVGSGMRGGEIALLKFCYVDIRGDTDVDALFEEYVGAVARLEAAVPDIRLIHVTVPLFAVRSAARDRMLELLGRTSVTAENAMRERYNEQLRQTFPANRLYDLARLEATRSDGSLAASRRGGRKMPMLAPEWTNDGGHLNDAGTRMAAGTFLDVLASAAAERDAGALDSGVAGRATDTQ